ncbi:hypothetical protein QCM80_30120 [Bradyrhizobium sp. SSUT112]|uniref:hypothetical protein n=1 Tax=Bradyrhizobium sp. SSUT112 TaxID=3040604 RepID=UPI002449E5D6|nr:hypothetical protein [Bradyrhizobium sp. SSUT112]MDH2354892.1 hypothetical protein [Bradyrhizobium sp. SSUT112]
MANKVVASGFYDDKHTYISCCQSDEKKVPVKGFHHPQNGVFVLDFDSSAFTGPIHVQVSSTGVAGSHTNDANAFVRSVNQDGCQIVTAVWDQLTNAFILANSGFYFTIIEQDRAGFVISQS